MFACIHATRVPATDALSILAGRFSPRVEMPSPETAVFDITPLRRIMGSPEAIASEVARRAHEVKISGNIAIASTPDMAILAARNLAGVTMIPEGMEERVLGALSIAVLPVDREALAVLDSWGIRTISEFHRLPEAGILERLGSAGQNMLRLVRGQIRRPLRPLAAGTCYEERLETEHPVSLLEPLSFLISRLLSELCGRLRGQSRATSEIRLMLELEPAPEDPEAAAAVPVHAAPATHAPFAVAVRVQRSARFSEIAAT